METKRWAPFERISFKLINWVGTPASLIIHSTLFISIFSLKFFGFTTDSLLLLLAAVVSLEAIYLTIFIQMIVKKNTQGLKAVETETCSIQEGEEKAHTALIHMGHQMKALQHELDTLRKNSIFKHNGNGQHTKLHA